MEHNNIRVNFNFADYSNLVFPEEDKQILSELGKKVAEIAARPIMKERAQLWKDHNMLKDTRPLILCDPENGWNEILPDKDYKCSNSIARHWESLLRKYIFWGDFMNDDMVIEPYFNLPYVFNKVPWMVGDKKAGANQGQKVADGTSYHIDTILTDYSQMDEIRSEELEIDYKTSELLLETAKEIFSGSLEARLNTTWFWSFGMSDEMAFLRGLENMMFDFYDEPEAFHQVMQKILDAMMRRMDFLEEHGLFCLNNDGTYVGSGGLGFTDELPAPDFSGRVRTKDMWGLAESQNTVSVSPEMFEEFIFPYQEQMMNRFGLSCYGCCEPLDKRFDIIKRVKNLRRVSVSYWADKEIMAQKLGKNYIYSLKPSPTDLAVPVMDQDHVRKSLREYLRIAKNNHVELLMKDNHTLGNNPENLLNWVRIAREEIENM